MLDLLAQALELPGLGWLLASSFAAGLVRGFAGFGTALVFLPVAAQVVSPVWAVITMLIMDMIGPAPAIPRALREGHRKDLLRLLGGTALALPLGILMLVWLDPNVFKLLVGCVSLAMTGLLISGFRLKNEVSPRGVWGIGGAAGILGGSAGIPGPPVILFNMASSRPARVIRANTTSYLYFYDAMMLLGLLIAGRLTGLPIMIGLVITLPALAGNALGGWLFDPKHERLYRYVAYTIIAASALSALISAATSM